MGAVIRLSPFGISVTTFDVTTFDVTTFDATPTCPAKRCAKPESVVIVTQDFAGMDREGCLFWLGDFMHRAPRCSG